MEDDSPSAPALSRRLAARKAAFLTAARDVFQEKGYAKATLDDVIGLSGGSRQTLYSLFGGKQGLFEALVTETCESIFGDMPSEKHPSPALEETLTEIGVRYLEVITSPPVLNLTRLVIAEAPRIPEIARRYWTLGPGRSRALLTTFLEKNGLASANAANYFLEMLSGTIRFQCLIGVRQPPDQTEIEEIVRAAVTRFLNGFAVAETMSGEPPPPRPL
jgi:AcrR family transcriptional regulator